MYKHFYTDFEIIDSCVFSELPYNVIEFLLSKHKGNFKEYNKNIESLGRLITADKFDIFKLYLKYGFDINGEIIVEDAPIAFSLFFFLIVFNEVTEERVKFLIDNGINIQSPIKSISEIDDEISVYSMLDFLIVQTIEPGKNIEVSYIKLLEYIFKYYSFINVQPIISLIFLGKEKQRISKKRLSNIIKDHIKFIDIDGIQENTINKIVSSSSINIIKIILSYMGIENFIKSNFYGHMKFIIALTNNKELSYSIDQLLSNNNNNNKSKDKKTNHIIFQKIKEKKLKNIKSILENERGIIDIRNSDNKTPLMFAIQYCIKKPEIIKLIMRYKPNRNLVDNNKFTALHVACLYNNDESIPKIITEENVNIKNVDGNTPLMIALKKKNYNCAFALLNDDTYINVNIPDNNNDTPLIYLLNNKVKHDTLYSLLTKKSAYINFEQFRSEFMIKIINNSSFLHSITENGLNILKNNDIIYTDTPLIYSIQENILTLAKALIEKYNIILENDKNGIPCIFYAINNDNEDYIKLLLESGKVNIFEVDEEEGRTPLVYSLELNKINCVKLLLYEYIKCFEKNVQEINNLKDMVNSHLLSIANELKLNVNKIDEMCFNNINSIDDIDKYCYLKIKNIILKVNFEQNIIKANNIVKSKEEENESHNVENEKTNINENCIENNNNNEKLKDGDNDNNEKLKDGDNDNNEKLKDADNNNNNEFKNTEKSNKIDESKKEKMVYCENYSLENFKDIDEYTVLLTACISGNDIIISSLVNTKIYDLNKRITQYKLTPLMLLICHDNYGCVKLLLENKADVNIKDIYGNTPLIYMLKYSKENKNIYDLLINNGAYIDYHLFKDEIFINNIISNKYFINLFLNKKIRVKYENDSEDKIVSTPLTFAIKLNNILFIQSLLNNNIKFDEIDNENNDPLMAATKIGNSEIIVLLKNYYKEKNHPINTQQQTQQQQPPPPPPQQQQYPQQQQQQQPQQKEEYVQIKNKDSSNISSGVSEIKESGDKDENNVVKKRNVYNEDYNIDFKLEEENCIDYPELYMASLSGNTMMINVLLENGDFDINEQASKYKFSPLMMLIVKEDYENAKLFLERNANANIRDINNNTPLIYMLKYSKFNGDIYDLLIENGAFIDYKLFNNHNFIASLIENFLFIRHFINKRIIIHYEDENKIELITNPLIFSIKTNYTKFVEVLLKNNVNINEENKNNEVNIIVNKMNNKKLIKLLNKYGFKVNPSITESIENKGKDKKDTNIEKKIDESKNNSKVDNNENDKIIYNNNNEKDIEIQDENRMHQNQNKLKTENEIINNQIKQHDLNNELEKENKEMRNDHSENESNASINNKDNGNKEIENRVNNKSEKIDDKNYNVEFMNDEETNVNYPELHIACIKGNTMMIKILLESNEFDINEQASQYKFSPLMLLIVKEDYENAKLLLEKHADTNIRDVNGNTPLIYMLKYSKFNEEIYNLLIENGAFIDYKLFINHTFIDSVIKNNLFIKQFINKSITINYENENKIELITKPLKFSIETNHLKFIETVLKSNINIDEENKNNELDIMVNSINNEKIKKLLNDYGIGKNNSDSLNIKTMNKETNLNSNEKIIENEIKNNINSNDDDNDDNKVDIINNQNNVEIESHSNVGNDYNKNEPNNIKNENEYENNNDNIKNQNYLNLIEDYKINFDYEKENNEYSELHLACLNENNSLLNILLESGEFNINEQVGRYKFSPLMISIIKEDYKNAKLLLNNHADVNIRDIYDNTPFTYMLKYLKINEEIYDLLIKNNAFIDFRLLNNPNFISKIIKNPIFINYFINKKIKCRYENDDKIELITKPLIFSINSNNSKFVETVLKASVDLNEEDKNNELTKTLENIVNKKIIKLLDNYRIKRNIDFNEDENKEKIESDHEINNLKDIPDSYSDEYNMNELIDENDNNIPEFHICCANGNTEMMKLLFTDDNFNINEQAGKYKLTPLMLLIIKEDYVNATLFINNNADVNVRDIYNNTPFIYMLKYLKTNKDLYDLLIKHDAFIDSNLFNNKMFMNQILKNQLFIQLLIERVIKINDENGNVKSIRQPLIFAVKRNNVEFVNLLIENGADINEFSYNGNTPLLQAIDNDNIEIIKLLIDNGVNLNQYNNEGKLPLEIAKEKNNTEIISLIENTLIQNNTVMYDTPSVNNSTFMYNNNSEVMDYNNNNYLLNIDQNNVNNLLFNFIKNGQVREAISQIQNGADVNYEGKNGLTPLLYAIHINNLKMIDLLISYGANVDLINKNGTTPVKYALNQGNIEIIKALIFQSSHYNENNIHYKLLTDEMNKNNILGIKNIINNQKTDQHTIHSNANNIQSNSYVSNISLFSTLNKNHDIAKPDYQKLNYMELQRNSSIDSSNQNYENITEDKGHENSYLNSDDEDNINNWYNEITTNDNEDSIGTNIFQCIDDKDYALARTFISLNTNYYINIKNEKGVNPLTYIVLNPETFENRFFDYLIENDAYLNKNVFDSSSKAIYYTKFLSSFLNKKIKIKFNNQNEPMLISQPLQFLINNKKYNYLNNILRMNKNGKLTEIIDELNHDQGVVKDVIRKGDIKALSILLKYINVNVKDENGKTLLMLAAEYKKINILDILLEYGANINAIDNYGETALFYAAKNNKLENVKFLVRNNANINIMNNRGKSVISFCAAYGKTRIFNYLCSVKRYY